MLLSFSKKILFKLSKETNEIFEFNLISVFCWIKLIESQKNIFIKILIFIILELHCLFRLEFFFQDTN